MSGEDTEIETDQSDQDELRFKRRGRPELTGMEVPNDAKQAGAAIWSNAVPH